jgi:hypothetical protein
MQLYVRSYKRAKVKKKHAKLAELGEAVTIGRPAIPKQKTHVVG